MSFALIVFLETKNSMSARWISRRDAASTFISSFIRDKKASELTDVLYFCVPDRADELPEMPTAQDATRMTGVESHMIECKKQGEAYGFREALRMIDDLHKPVATFRYPGSVDWTALALAQKHLDAEEGLRVISFKSKLDPDSNRGLENLYVRACVLKTVSESAMFATMEGDTSDAWVDVILVMCERLLVTQAEIKRVEWPGDEGILLCDAGDRVVFAENGVSDNDPELPSLSIYRGDVDRVFPGEKRALISFEKDENGVGRKEKISFDLFRVMRRYTPVCFLEDMDRTCFLIRQSLGPETISQSVLFTGFRSILESLNKARVISLLTQVTADATENARAYFLEKQNMDPDVVEGVLALSKLDGMRQTASLTGHVQDFPMEEACARSWDDRPPLPLMVRENEETCEVVPLSLAHLLRNRDPWFSSLGRRATRAFLLAYCGKARVAIEGL